MATAAVVDRPKLETMRIVTGCTTAEHFISAFHRFCDAKTCFIPSVDTRPVGSTLAFSLRLADGTPMLRGTCVVKAAWKTPDNPFKRAGVQLEISKLTTESNAVFEQLLAHKTVVTRKLDAIPQTASHETTNQHVPLHKAADLILRQGNAPAVAKPPATPPPLPGSTTKRAIDVPSVEPPTLGTAGPDAPTALLPTIEDAPTAQHRAAVEEPARTIEMPPLQYKTESRTPGSAFVLPANPLTDVDDAALDALFAKCTVDDDEPIDDDLSIPVLPPPPNRDDIKTLLGVAPLAAARDTVKTPAFPMPVARDGTAPLALPARAPASRSMSFALHAMTHQERMWYLCAIGAGLLVAALVLVTTIVFAR